MNNNAPSRRLRYGRLSLLTAGILLATNLAAQEARHGVNLPAQPLDQALNALAGQTGTRILFATDSAENLRAPALSGELSVEQALQQLLRGSILSVEKTADGSFVVAEPVAAGNALDLGVTLIQGQGMGAATENSGSYTTGLVSVGSKTPVSLKDTPQAVSIISQQMVEDQRMTTLSDAMKWTPGITLRNANYNTLAFYSRGFGIDNLQIDGAAPMDIGTGVGTFYSERQYDMAAYDHVEVLRGASALLGGSGDPGAIVNLVRKRPLGSYQLKLNSSAGSWDNYRSEVDLTGPLGFEGRLRGRAVAAYTDRQYFMDNRSTAKPFLYGIVEADLSDDTLLTLGGSYDKVKENGTGDGLPRYSTGGDLKLPRHRWFTNNRAWSDSDSREWFAKLDHHFNEDWTLNSSYTHSFNTATTEGVIPYGSVDETTNSGTYWWGSYVSSWSKQSVFDVNLSGGFEAFGRRHELLLGADYQKVTSRWRAALGVNGKGGLIDLWNPGATPLPDSGTSRGFWRDYSPNTREQYGAYSTLRLQLTDPLKLVLGARAQRYKFEHAYSTAANTDGTGGWTTDDPVHDRVGTTLVPYGGVIYALDDEWSAYASYSRMFKPQSLSMQAPEDAPTSIEPMTGRAYETGLKGELFGGAMNVGAALFHITRENQAVTDPAYPNPPFGYSGSCCFLAQDKITSKGIDLEASGEIAPGWQLLAGYTYNQVRNDTESTLHSTITPRHMLKLWSVYTLPGALSDWRVGGGMTATSPTYVSGKAYRFDAAGNAVDSHDYDFSQSGYALYDAMVEYDVDEHWTVALNGRNLFDRTYYASVGTSEYGNYYGEPRNFTLTLRGTFW